MRLSSLTINGFKSFGDRVTLEFAPGVTAVVGPNGSGKSNVIDALRWATGGGRASEFRAGDKTELIFHGAAGKKGLSYAEVELELKGAERPIRIARSLYRDGQSKLRLNGRSARFLDLEEELSGSGLGRGGLAMIGQGQVSQVLMADPAKLLSYVAEAAGVSKFAARREQTQARLDSTREHLARLEDLMRELERQLEHLKAEASQAARAGELNRDVLQLKYTLSLRRVEGLESELAGLTTQRQELVAAVEEGRSQLEAAQNRWQQGRERLADLEEAYRRALTDAEARRGDLRVAEERLKSAASRQEALDAECRNLETEIARLADLAPPAPPEGDEAGLEQARVAAVSRREAAQGALNEAEAGLQTLAQQLEAARLERSRAEGALASYERQKQELEASLGSLATRLAELEAVDVQALQEEETKRDALLRRRDATQRELDTLNERLADLHQQHAKAVAEAQALTRAAQRGRSAFEARQGYAQGPRQALTSGIKGVIGSVADLVRVPKEYELAVGSALGRRAENVVVENSSVARQVLEHLKRTGGWVTLLPLDLMKQRGNQLDAKLRAAPGVIGLASELVDFEPRFAGIVNQLLGGTLLVSDMDRAVALARQFPQRPRLVTLEGDLLESYGAISGGRRQVNTELLGLAAGVEEAEAAAQSAEREAARLTGELKELQERVRNTQSDAQGLNAELRALEQVVGQSRERAAAQRSLYEELVDRRAELVMRLEQLVKPEEPDTPDQVEELEAAYDRARSRLSALRQEADQAGEAEAEARQSLAVFRERHETYRQALRRFEEQQQRLAELRERQQELHAQQGAAAQEREDAETAVAKAQAALPQDLRDKEAAYLEAKRQSADAEAGLGSLTQAQAERGSRLEDLQLTLARREAALELAREELRGFPAGLEPREGSPKVLRDALAQAERELSDIGPVNHRARQECETQQHRLEELQTQSTEAGLAVHELESVLHDIDRETNARLGEAIGRLRAAFLRHVRQLFGPSAEAAIEVAYEEGRPTGLSIGLQPPGKQTRSLNLLSVGERTMGALAFLFALMSESDPGDGSPTVGRRLPIAILDEVDAPLDEANIRRFRDFLQRLAAQGTQFILITHQKATMEVADALWGVTTELGVSRVFSINRDEAVAAS